MTEKPVGQWDEYIDNFLKSVNVKDENDAFVCIDVVEHIQDDNSKSIRLILSHSAESQQYLFDLNKTNAVFIKNTGINQPRMCIGKKLYFKKVNVPNPTTKQIVESLRVCKVE